jgi:hypothetical protein
MSSATSGDRDQFDLTILLVELHSHGHGSPTTSSCSTSAARSPRATGTMRNDPLVIEAYLGAPA